MALRWDCSALIMIAYDRHAEVGFQSIFGHLKSYKGKTYCFRDLTRLVPDLN